MFTLIFFSALIIVLMTVMLFHPPTVARLQARDEAIRSKPVPEFFRDSRLLRAFYPATRKSKMPVADQVLIWVILVAVVLVFYEIGALIGWFPKDEAMISYATCVLLLIFACEFILRFWMKGFSYMLPWGAIDLLVIVIDLIAVIIFFGFLDQYSSEYGFVAQSPEGAAFLRVLRVARLMRALKLVRYTFDKQRRQLFWRKAKPHLKALAKLTLIVLVITFSFGSIVSIARDQSPLEGWAAIISQVLNNLGSSDDGDPFALAAAVLIIAALANMIAIFYAPIMERIRIEQSKTNNLDLLEGHVIICMNDEKIYGGFLEELIHVFNKSADKQVFVIRDGVEEVNLSKWDNISIIEGEKEDPATWRSCVAHSADALILLGSHRVLSENDFHNFMCPGGKRIGNDAVVFDIVNKGENYVRSRLGPSAQKVQVHLANLIDSIEQNAWNRKSLQFAFLHKLTDEFEDILEFPDLSDFSGNNESAVRLSEILREAVKAPVVRRGNNLLIDLTTDDSDNPDIPEELLELRRLEVVIKEIRNHSDLATETCVFAYVAAFELIGRNSDLSNEPNAHLSVFAVEFAAALSLFHELMAPGILKGWFSKSEVVYKTDPSANVSLRPLQKRQRLLSPENLAKRLDLSDCDIVVGLLDVDGKLSVTTRSTNRFEKNRSEFAIVL